MDELKLVDQYLEKLDWEVRENSNMTYSLSGGGGSGSPQGDFHIHDLQVLSVYCMGWDLMDLLMTGFKGVPGKIESRLPRHFTSALSQAVNFLYTLQSEAAGAQAFSNFDTMLAPFIRYDGLNYRQVKQAIQEFVYNLNVPTRTGFQTGFL